jgi:hypothetical protein
MRLLVFLTASVALVGALPVKHFSESTPALSAELGASYCPAPFCPSFLLVWLVFLLFSAFVCV